MPFTVSWSFSKLYLVTNRETQFVLFYRTLITVIQLPIAEALLHNAFLTSPTTGSAENARFSLISPHAASLFLSFQTQVIHN